MSDIRVLIVDDSPTVCSIFRRGLERAEGITVVGVAANPYVARDMIVKDPPDVLTLDIEMPRMDGLTFLRKLMKHFPMPVVVVSTLTTRGSQTAMEALTCGAVEVVAKNLADDQVGDLMLEIVRKVRSAARARVSRKAFSETQLAASSPRPRLAKVSGASDRIVAIGASTGGTDALGQILSRMPADAPATVIVQHMPAGFTDQMAKRLDQLSAMEVREARNGDLIQRGLALVAPGDRHLLVKSVDGQFRVELRGGPKVSRHKPSVDVLFRSMAQAVGDEGIGVILTGMGRDGADSMLKMKDAGAYNIAQDEESCVVFGMPREAIEIGATDETAPLGRIADRICAAASLRHV